MTSRAIAITGKGGTGKTTVAGILITRMIQLGLKPVLAVDADPNSCLDQVLGVESAVSVGAVREEARNIAQMSDGISKRELLEVKIAESLVEADNFDLISMGRPEGPGCYCYANNVLRDVLKTVSQSYPYIVIDNEAGLENLSRRIVQDVDVLIMVADPSKRGLETIERLYKLASEMEIKYKKSAIIVNRVRNINNNTLFDQLHKELGTDYLLVLPDDDQLADYAEEGRPLQELPDSNKVCVIIDDFIKTNLKF